MTEGRVGMAGCLCVLVVVVLATVVGGLPAPFAAAPIGASSLVDDRGRTVQLPAGIRRVVPLFPPSVDEYLVVTGRPETLFLSQRFNRTPIESGLLGRVFPSTRQSGFMPRGPLAAASVESMLKLEPDVVFATPNVAASLERVGLTSIGVENPGDLRYAQNTARLFSLAVGRPERAQQLQSHYDSRMAELATDVAGVARARPRVAMIYYFQGRISANGPRSLVGSFIEAGGGSNAFGTGNVIALDRERLLRADPDVIIVQNTASPQSTPKTILNDSTLASLSAVKHRRVYRMIPAIEFFPMGLLGYPAYARWMAELLHPDLDARLRVQIQDDYEQFTGYRMTDTDLDDALAVSQNLDQSNYARFAAAQ